MIADLLVIVEIHLIEEWGLKGALINSMLPSLKKITSSFLIVWLSAFTILSVLHVGHSHDLLPVEQNMCDQDCNDSSHRSAGNSCEWFTAQRLVVYSGSFLNDSPSSLLVFIYKAPKIFHIFYSSPEHLIFSTRAPPVLYS